jgi:hypothetical protein
MPLRPSVAGDRFGPPLDVSRHERSGGSNSLVNVVYEHVEFIAEAHPSSAGRRPLQSSSAARRSRHAPGEVPQGRAARVQGEAPAIPAPVGDLGPGGLGSWHELSPRARLPGHPARLLFCVP